MFELEIPGFGLVRLEHLVTDFTGTLSVDGKLIPGVKERLNKISEFLKIHVLTADTFGKAKEALSGINCEIHILQGKDQDLQKEKFVKNLGADKVIAFGNGNNDRKMLKVAKIGVAVLLEEGCSVEALCSADILVKSILDGLDLLLNPLRLKATLRF
ncbi:Haloacid dehalogenase domain protein hydrolase type 3 [Thermodesulfobacterium geofontis OPF15]|jgi:soluble P-type ATPase|uniref:Haloacid dehalogenase domain protein hydrolase type 3 n=1 Tax=Thermodesulfobacterium geofontis (strain OPF15) TaxID=795359 RepID=F8C580_THEGP|nr:HAD hydrolase family protein [Thermodesulfobacterium geofontis]AEH22847.1 Haloacid dehalogenase domain protein hydrolase type 3 [Thermodesulfobacterium geofontis OPF15]